MYCANCTCKIGRSDHYCSPTCIAAADAIDQANDSDNGKYEARLSPEDKARFEAAFAEAQMVHGELERLMVAFRLRRRSEFADCIWRFFQTLPLTSIDGMLAWSKRGYAFHSKMNEELKKLEAAQAA